MAEALRPLHRTHKPKGGISDQQRRRDLALERQKTARKSLQDHARYLALSSNCTVPIVDEPDDEASDKIEIVEQADLNEVGNVHSVAVSELDSLGNWVRIDKDSNVTDDGGEMGEGDDEREAFSGSATGMNQSGQNEREWYSKQLTVPEWMIDIPKNLSKEWYVMPRPEGQRCLVVSCNGRTVSRLSSGRILHKFPSSLPNGARARSVAAPSHIYCILDCVFNEANQTYYILDAMCWKGYSLYDCSSEFRLFWLSSKLEECGASAPPSALHRFPFISVPVFECNFNGLRSAYEGAVTFKRDGLLFYNKHAHYTLGVTPLVLRWKDTACSEYVVDTNSQGVIPEDQMVVLELSQDGKLVTSDNPPVELASMPREFVENSESYWKKGTLLRFSIKADAIQTADSGAVSLHGIKLEGLAKRRGGVADSLSKILFQHAARTDPITIADLIAASNEEEEAMASAE